MDDSYPILYYLEPTLDMGEHLEQLAQETGRPLRLKYPLRFLDEISTPNKLTEILDELSSKQYAILVIYLKGQMSRLAITHITAIIIITRRISIKDRPLLYVCSGIFS